VTSRQYWTLYARAARSASAGNAAPPRKFIRVTAPADSHRRPAPLPDWATASSPARSADKPLFRPSSSSADGKDLEYWSDDVQCRRPACHRGQCHAPPCRASRPSRAGLGSDFLDSGRRQCPGRCPPTGIRPFADRPRPARGHHLRTGRRVFRRGRSRRISSWLMIFSIIQYLLMARFEERSNKISTRCSPRLKADPELCSPAKKLACRVRGHVHDGCCSWGLFAFGASTVFADQPDPGRRPAPVALPRGLRQSGLIIPGP